MQQNLVQNSGGIAELVYKVRVGSELSPVDKWCLNVRRNMMLLSFQSMYQEVQTGPLEEIDIPQQQWAASFESDPGILRIWKVTKGSMSPDFVRFMEDHVLPLIEPTPSDE